MKRIAEWLTVVGAAAGRSGKRLVAVVAAIAMLGDVTGVNAIAMADGGNTSTTQSQTTDEKAAASAPALLSAEGINGVPDNPTLSAPAHERTVTTNGNGAYKVALNVTGTKSTGTGATVTNQSLDIVLVLDVSGSVTDNLNDGPRRIDALKTAVNGFADATADENVKITNQSQQNRIALVKFAGTGKTIVGNDFYREGWSSYNYTQIISNLTYDVFGLTSTVNNLSVPGTASVDYAFSRAQATLTYQPRASAKEVVIFFIDGEPNHGSGFDPTVTVTAVNKVKSLRGAGTTIYSIGVVSSANPSSTSSNLNKYTHGISSGYPDATVTSNKHLWGKSWDVNLGDRAETSSYYKAATDTDQLSNIFESIYQEITKAAEYANVTIHDRLSSQVVSPDSISKNEKPVGFTYTKTRKSQTMAWVDVPKATVTADGTMSQSVTSNDDTLEDSVTYTVSFSVKPMQAASDRAVKSHKDDANASGDNNFYTNNNSGATVDCKTVVASSQGGTTTSDLQTAAYPQKPTIALPVSKIAVTKAWSGDNENHTNDSVQVRLKQNGEDYANGPATLNAAGNQTREFTMPAGPEGHTYSVSEIKVEGYDSKVGKTNLKLQGLAAQSGAFTVANTPSYVTLPASDVKVTKVVQGHATDSDFDFNLKCVDSTDADVSKCADVTGLANNGLTTTVSKDELTASGANATVGFGNRDLKLRVPIGTDNLVYTFEASEDIEKPAAGWKYNNDKVTVKVTVSRANTAVSYEYGEDDSDRTNTESVQFTNKYVAISSLPLTSGTTGRDWMVFGGGLGLLTLLIVVGYTVWRKRQLV